MVFIESRSEYFKQFAEEHEKEAGLLGRIILEFPKVCAETVNEISTKELKDIINSIYSNDQKILAPVIINYSIKNPNSSSSWIYNDFLIFLLIVAIRKFQLNGNWLINAISQRITIEEDQLLIVDFFTSALNGATTKVNINAFLLVNSFFVDPNSLDNEKLKISLNELNYQTFPRFKSAFLNILHLKAFDIILDLKGIRNQIEFDNLIRFETAFLKRTKVISKIISYIFLVIFLCVVYILSRKLFVEISENTRNIIIAVLGISGFTILEILKSKKNINNKILKLVLRSLGYQS